MDSSASYKRKKFVDFIRKTSQTWHIFLLTANLFRLVSDSGESGKKYNEMVAIAVIGMINHRIAENDSSNNVFIAFASNCPNDIDNGNDVKIAPRKLQNENQINFSFFCLKNRFQIGIYRSFAISSRYRGAMTNRPPQEMPANNNDTWKYK